MIDGVDGLAGSTGIATLALLAAAAAYAGNDRLATGLVLMIGALAAFLLFNMRSPWNPRARLFLGNAGSEFLGLVIACASFRLTQNGLHPVGAQLAPFLAAPALIDCLTLIACRLRRGRSPFEGDRNHVHYLMLDAGFSVTAIVGLLAGLTLGVGALAAIALKAHVPAPVFTVVFVSLLAGHFFWSHRREQAVRRLAKLRRGMRSIWTRPVPAPPAFAAPILQRRLSAVAVEGEGRLAARAEQRHRSARSEPVEPMIARRADKRRVRV
jgi:UDP-GlcNAc:undecaprenyl-phosphate GlcNAc-1-phosphate transferase